MPLPNLSNLRQRPTGHLQNSAEWLNKQGGNPNRDPITTEDWRAEVRKAEEDGPPPENGWILEVDTGDRKRTPEPGYLYDVEALAQHLLNGGKSPISRLPAHEDDKRECINMANDLRRAKGLPNLKPMTPGAPPAGDELPPLPALSRAAGRHVSDAEERRREVRSRWSGTVYPPLSENDQSRYEEWYLAIPEGGTESFLRNANAIYRNPSLVVDEAVLSESMTQLLTMLDRLLLEAPAAAVTGLYTMAADGRLASMGENQDVRTNWMDNLWQMVGAWNGLARRRRIRGSWGGRAYPILTAEARNRYERWLRALPPSAAEAFLQNASQLFQRPQIVDDLPFALFAMDLRNLFEELIREAETAPEPPPAMRVQLEAAAYWAGAMEELRAFATRGSLALVRNDQDGAMTDWVNSVWQMLEAWRGRIPAARAMQQLPSFPPPGDEEEERAGVARLAEEAAARARAARAGPWAAARAVAQMMPGYRPGDPVRGEAQQQLLERLQQEAREQRDRELQEAWQRQLDARDPAAARLRREAPPSGTPEHAEWVRRQMS